MPINRFAIKLSNPERGQYTVKMLAHMDGNHATQVTFLGRKPVFANVQNFEEHFMFAIIEGNVRGYAGLYVIYQDDDGARNICHADTYEIADGHRLATYSVHVTEVTTLLFEDIEGGALFVYQGKSYRKHSADKADHCETGYRMHIAPSTAVEPFPYMK